MKSSISGIHHVTAIASDPQRTLDFYTDLLGLRLVKKTVNFDDPGATRAPCCFKPSGYSSVSRRSDASIAASCSIIATAVPPQ